MPPRRNALYNLFAWCENLRVVGLHPCVDQDWDCVIRMVLYHAIEVSMDVRCRSRPGKGVP